MTNADMPAMPTEVMDKKRGHNGMETFMRLDGGLTKRETFAMNAPIMPVWFELEFLQNPELNGGNDYLVVSGQNGATSQEGYKAMFMAWPLYYADALLKQLESGNET